MALFMALFVTSRRDIPARVTDKTTRIARMMLSITRLSRARIFTSDISNRAFEIRLRAGDISQDTLLAP